MFNLNNFSTIKEYYQNGLLPQRNSKKLFYFQTSCRSNLSVFNLSSENRRILNKTTEYISEVIPLGSRNLDGVFLYHRLNMFFQLISLTVSIFGGIIKTKS